MKCTKNTRKGARCKRDAVNGEKLCASHLKSAHRPTKLTPEISEAICTALRAGNFQEVAAIYAGVSPATFYDWKARGEAGEAEFAEFLEAVTRARAEAEVVAVAGIRKAMVSSDEAVALKAQTWYLAHAHPQRWARRQILEHSGPEGGPMQAKVDFADEEVRDLGHALLAKLAAGGD